MQNAIKFLKLADNIEVNDTSIEIIADYSI